MKDYGFINVSVGKIAVHLKDNKDGISTMLIDGDEMEFAMNGDLFVKKKGKCVAMFKENSFMYTHKY